MPTDNKGGLRQGVYYLLRVKLPCVDKNGVNILPP